MRDIGSVVGMQSYRFIIPYSIAKKQTDPHPPLSLLNGVMCIVNARSNLESGVYFKEGGAMHSFSYEGATENKILTYEVLNAKTVLSTSYNIIPHSIAKKQIILK